MNEQTEVPWISVGQRPPAVADTYEVRLWEPHFQPETYTPTMLYVFDGSNWVSRNGGLPVSREQIPGFHEKDIWRKHQP